MQKPLKLIFTFFRFPETTLRQHNTLLLSLNYDGLPLYKSSSKVFWPILATFRNLIPTIIFPLLICFGTSKPSNLLFLNPLIDQLNTVISNGIKVKGLEFKVFLNSIVADAPARAHLKQVKGHGGYYGCGHCTGKIKTLKW